MTICYIYYVLVIFVRSKNPTKLPLAELQTPSPGNSFSTVIIDFSSPYTESKNKTYFVDEATRMVISKAVSNVRMTTVADFLYYELFLS